MRKASLLLFVLLTACARTPPAPMAPPKTPIETLPPAPSPPAPPRLVEETPEEEIFSESSSLRLAISQWIAQHEEADFDEVSREANRLMRKHGYPLVLDASPLLQPGQASLRLKAGKRTFVFLSGKELAPKTDLCGERFVRLPARLLGRDRAALVSGGKLYPFSLRLFRRERFRVFHGKRLVSTFFAPEPTEPIGISGNAQALLLRFPLDEELVSPWWSRIGNSQPSLLDEEPYLVLRVGRKTLYFDENIEHLPAQEFEVDSSDRDYFRWRFLPTGLTLVLSSQCGN